MGVLCFASLKGGVGKTSLSVNIAHAFSERGCQTLLIDLDPTGHATQFFVSPDIAVSDLPSPLARLFLSYDLEESVKREGSIVEAAISHSLSMILQARPCFDVLPAGPELRHFLWGQGARVFKTYFRRLVEELHGSYDYIVIDTPPDFNVLTRTSLAAADLVVVPVDASAMSIRGLEEIVSSASHIEGPAWSIIRTMVSRQASRMHRLTESRLGENLSIRSGVEDEEDAGEVEADIEDADCFISLLAERERREGIRQGRANSKGEKDSPIFLLDSVIYRTEQQNRLSFLGRTAFDARGTAKLAEQYRSVARELEQVLTICEYSGPDVADENYLCTLAEAS